jgi:hypothetical protein
MLSRVAENLFWMARYIERADGLARLMDQAYLMEFDGGMEGLSPEESNGYGPLETILDILACRASWNEYSATKPGLSAADLLHWLAFKAEDGHSIRSMVTLARENARSTQESLSAEVWNQVNRMHLAMISRRARGRFLASPTRFLDWVKRACVLTGGLVNDTLPRDEPYQFLQLGCFLERIDMTSRILASSATHVLLIGAGGSSGQRGELEEVRWSGMLKSVGAKDAFLRRFRGQITSEGSLRFLLLEQDFPRSLRFSLKRCLESLQEISGSGFMKYISEAERLLGRLESDLRYLEPEDVLDRGLVDFLGQIQNTCSHVGAEIARECFT